ncbi:hypothetical protein [Fluviicola taffensis]|uniref:Uncharacterized protein n=1 Tax=Fluviicola taffensis (strain DSM 16823 / NCIMB 13979 / RW262) TaxID=755732 RepID=F2IJI1_FLUTR|nr:hypothetical protein [Fluviicola taffensis]AEA42869.1 hypothetical protein Fluta_0868 [Fluviicola taffensis DSM 16823]
MNANIVAQFKLEICFQLTNRSFFLCGEIVSGKLSYGQFLDLTPIGIPKQIQIEEIEFIRKNKNGEVKEITALGTRELNDKEKEYLKQISEFDTPLNILKQL